jgi:hypothetical protein
MDAGAARYNGTLRLQVLNAITQSQDALGAAPGIRRVEGGGQMVTGVLFSGFLVGATLRNGRTS